MIGGLCKFIGGYVLAGTIGGSSYIACTGKLDVNPETKYTDMVASAYIFTVLSPFMWKIWSEGKNVDYSLTMKARDNTIIQNLIVENTVVTSTPLEKMDATPLEKK